MVRISGVMSPYDMSLYSQVLSPKPDLFHALQMHWLRDS